MPRPAHQLKSGVLLSLSGLMLLAGGCQSAVTVCESHDALGTRLIELANDTVRVQIAPDLGRIIAYGYRGGANVLWDNRTHASTDPTQWANLGGAKIWFFPQRDWETITGKAWPPPNDTADTRGYDIQTIDHGLRLTSAVHRAYHVRVVTDICLASHGTEVQISSRLEAIGTGSPRPVVPWLVVQVPAGDGVVARRRDGRLPRAITDVDQNDLPSPRTQVHSNNELAITPAEASGKIFLDADDLQTKDHGTTFRMTFDSDTQHRVISHVYIEGARGPIQRPGAPYAEMEFSPPADALPHLEVVWRLSRR